MKQIHERTVSNDGSRLIYRFQIQGPNALERINRTDRRQRVVLLVSRFDHCPAYLLHRWKVGDLNIEIPV